MNEEISLMISGGNFWLASMIYVLLTGLGAFFGGYILKKAGHLATKEDFADMRAQLRATTSDAEEIKQQLSRHTWINQQQWSARELYYGKLLAQLHNFILALDGLSSYYIEPDSVHVPDSKQGAHFHRLKQNAADAFEELKKLLGPAALYLPKETVKELDEMQKRHWELVEFEVSCTAEYVEQAHVIAMPAYEKVLSDAKRQLGIA